MSLQRGVRSVITAKTRRQKAKMSFLMVDNPTDPRGPRFKVSDSVKVVVPGNQKGKVGVVVEVVQSPTGDFVHRYRVQFPEGNLVDTFFGFELELQEAES